MNFQDILNSVTAGVSDYSVSKKLGISRQAISGWRNEGKIPNDETLDKIAELGGFPKHKVYLAAYAEKIHNPEVATVFRTLAA